MNSTGLYLTYKGKQYHVSLKDIKATGKWALIWIKNNFGQLNFSPGLWEGKGPLENRNFKQADIRSATLGNIPGNFSFNNQQILPI